MRRVATTALYGVFVQLLPEGGELGEYRGSHLADPCRAYTVKRDGEWRIIYEIFRDMRLPVLPICLLMGASFCFYLRLLILGGMMPGHAYHAHSLFILDAPIFNGLDVFLPSASLCRPCR